MEETSLNTTYILKESFCYIFRLSKFRFNFVTISDDIFKDNSDKSKSVIKDKVGRNDILILFNNWMTENKYSKNFS